jgi:AAA domain
LVSTFDFLSPGGHPIFVTRLPNQRDPKRPPINRYVRNETELQKFIADYDEPGYALYHAVAILEEGSWRNKANVRATRYIWTEVDFKDHPDFSAEEIRRRIESIPLKPTAVIFSGHGYHLYWQLREDVDAKPGEAQQQVEEALRLAVNYVGGDTQVAEAARLMRLPGSHNTRVAGEELPVVFDVLEMSRAYSLNELVDFFLEAVPILPPPAKKANGSGHDAGGFNFEAQEQPAGRVDAENELDAIHNGASANQVQCRVIPSLIWKAWHPNEIVRFVVDGTMQAAERAGLGWDRATEVEHVVARVLSAYHNMFESEYDPSTGVIPVWLPGEFHEVWTQILVEGRRPTIMRNASGFYVRRARESGGATGEGAAKCEARTDDSSRGSEETGGIKQGGDPKPPDLLGDVWHFGDPIAEQTPMLVPDLVPAHGFGNLGGQWGTMKTFILNDLAVALACGGVFAGRQVTVRGAVVSIELEGSHNEARMIAAAMARNCQREKLPIIHLKKAPPKILVNRNPNPRFKEYAAALVTYARAFAAARGVPLVLITIDPQNRIAGYTDEQSSAEGQIVSDALTELARAAGCTVLVSDHFGKDPSAGLRGTSAKETNPLFILNTSEQQKDVFAQRYLEIRKMRNGPQGMAIDFKMEKCDALVDQIIRDKETGTTSVATTTVATLQVLWSDELRPVEFQTREKATTTGDGLTPKSRRALKILNELVDDIGLTIPPSCGAPPGSRGVTAKVWADCLVKQKGLGGKNPMAGLSHLMEPLIAQDKIGAADGLVWPTQIEDDSNTSE